MDIKRCLFAPGYRICPDCKGAGKHRLQITKDGPAHYLKCFLCACLGYVPEGLSASTIDYVVPGWNVAGIIRGTEYTYTVETTDSASRASPQSWIEEYGYTNDQSRAFADAVAEVRTYRVPSRGAARNRSRG